MLKMMDFMQMKLRVLALVPGAGGLVLALELRGEFLIKTMNFVLEVTIFNQKR